MLGAVIELLLLRPMRGADIDTTMLIMIGCWIVLQNTEQMIWGGVAKSIVTPLPGEPLVIGPISVAWLRVIVFVVAGLLIAATYLLIHRTRLGKAMRATFQDRDTAALMGVNVQAINTATFAIGSGLAAAAGALLGAVFVVTPTMGDLAALKLPRGIVPAVRGAWESRMGAAPVPQRTAVPATVRAERSDSGVEA